MEDILTLTDGRFVHPRAVWQVFKDDRTVLQYQLTQGAPERFELTLTTLTESEFEQAVARARPTLAHLLGSDSTIEASRRSELDPRTGGKFRAVVSRRPPISRVHNLPRQDN